MTKIVDIDLKKINTIHFTGIKGVGMTALALCAQDMGKTISGSDTDETFPTSQILEQRQISSQVGFSANHVPKDCNLVIYTGAHGGATNIEVKTAQSKNISVLSHAQALRLFTLNKKTIATAGVGGKSTTAAIISHLFDAAGFNPSFAVGVGNILPLGTPGRFTDNSDMFVVESDEYVTDPQADLTPRFHYLDPYIAIITNLEHDHPDVYPSIQDMFKAFKVFVSKIPKDGAIIVNIDNSNIQNFIQTITGPIISYGFSPQADWQILNPRLKQQKQYFTLRYKKINWPEFSLGLPGRYNLLNATAAAVCAYHLGMSPVRIQSGLDSFIGTQRRFEYIGKVNNILLYDDYAHHPIEIKALLKAAKQWFPKRRIIIIFQSHTYSRTKVLLSQFARSFTLANQVIINNIFASAREKDNLGITGAKLAQAISQHQPNTQYCAGKSATIEFLTKTSQPGDVIFTVGAGDNWLWHQDILKALENISDKS